MTNSDDPRLDIARANIRMACALHALNFAEVSRRAGMSRNAVSQFISGRTVLSYANMLRICDVLQVPICLVHQASAITENRIRLARAINRMPDHLAAKAFGIAQDELGNFTD